MTSAIVLEVDGVRETRYIPAESQFSSDGQTFTFTNRHQWPPEERAKGSEVIWIPMRYVREIFYFEDWP
jgi:hypothetical protein